MNKNVFLVIFTLFSFAVANNNSDVTITTHSYQKVIKMDKKGKKTVEWIKVKKAIPGDTIKFVNSVKNSSTKIIKDVLVKNRINPNLRYIPNSAKSSTKSSIKFSVDGGKSFKTPKNLFIIKGGKKVAATYKDYNAIEWKIDSIESNKSVNVEFKAKIK